MVAIIQPHNGAKPSLEEIQAWCKDKLAGYKVPRSVCLVDQVVRSPAGKADYRWAADTAIQALVELHATDACLAIIAANPGRIDGIKISLLDEKREIEMRRRLPAGVRMV